MNKVTVTNVATFEDCCEWFAKTRGREARDTFEMQVRKIRPFPSLQGRPLTPVGIRAIYDVLDWELTQEKSTWNYVCDRIEQNHGKWAVHHLKNLLLLRTAQQERELNYLEILETYDGFVKEIEEELNDDVIDYD